MPSYEVNVEELSFKTLEKVRGYLQKMLDNGGSDLHIKANATVRARFNGEITPLSDELFTKEDGINFAKELLRGRFPEFVEKKELDLVYPFNEDVRFRVNIFFQMDGVSAVFRTIPVNILTIDELELPAVIHKFVSKERGLLLVTGVTGSGKSTTMAAIVDEINRTQKKHIITIEDPIEFVHKDKQCIVNQRSLGQDTLSFSNALRAALREDPDIILVGEMRDVETIEMALHAAETGHLVISTLHTIDAKETINRIIGMFPVDEQNRVRLSLSNVLAGVLSQRLVPTVDGKRIAAVEILWHTSRIEELIATNRDSEVIDAIEEGKDIYGSQSFDQALLDLFRAGKISETEALKAATSPSDFKLKMSGMGSAVPTNAEPARRIDPAFDSDDVFELKT